MTRIVVSQSRRSRIGMFDRGHSKVFLAVSLLLAALVIPSSSASARRMLSRSAAVTTRAARAGLNDRTLTLYGVSSNKEFVNNADDRARGEGNNPFGNYSGASAPQPPSEKLFGPFAGDEGEYAFKLYTSSNIKSYAGSAIFVCQYNFNANAFCDAAFQLQGGALVGKGTSNFNVTTFSLAILGGTFKYRGMKGHVTVSALGRGTLPQPVVRVVPMLEAQRMAFVLRAAA
jgi:hypothetical protein